MKKTIEKKLDALDEEEREILARDCSDQIIEQTLERTHLSFPTFSDVVVASAGTPDEDFDIMKHARFFKIDEIVFETETDVHLPGVESVISSMRDSSCSLVFLVRGTKSETSVYVGISDAFGVADADYISSALESYEAAWKAYFPGMKTSAVMRAEIENIASDIRHRLPNIGVLTGIPSLKREEDENSFVQGLERLIRAMRGKSYCWISIADPIPQGELRAVIGACRSLQSDVHRFIKTDISKSKSKGKTAMFGGFGMGGTGSAESSGENVTKYSGDHQGWLDSFAHRVLGSGNLSRWISGKSPTTFFRSMSESVQSAMGYFGSVSVSFTDTTTLGQEVLNRKAEHAEEVLKAYEERLEEGVALGMWNLGHYFCASDKATYEQGTGVVRALFSGMESKYEPPRAIKMPKEFGTILRRFQNVYLRFGKGGGEFADHPLGIFFNGPGTPVNTRELAIAAPIATQDVEGVTVSKRPSFGLNVSAEQKECDSLLVGKILDKGNETPQEYKIARKNLPKHLAVFGLTGSGKTNTIHRLLRSLRGIDPCGKKTPFLVIEPAKAEYRALAKSKELKDELLVFSAGIDATEVCPLRLNPFDFDPGENCDARRVHVLTHIDRLKATFNASFPMYGPMPYVLEEAILEVYRDRGWDLGRSENRYVDIYAEKDRLQDYIPTLQDLYLKIDAVVKRKGYFNEQTMNIQAALKARISSLMVGAKGAMFNCSRSVPAEDLFEKPVIIELENMGDDDEKAFLMGLLVSRLYEYRKATFSAGKNAEGEPELKHVLVIEEAHRLLTNVPESAGTMETANVKGKSVAAFVDMLSEVRALGQSVIVADQLPSRVSPNIVKGTGTKIVHRLLAKDDRESVGETMGLNEDQIQDLCLLRTGECVVSQDGDCKAYMCRVKKDAIHDERQGGEISDATRKYRDENAALFALPDKFVSMTEDERFKDDLQKAMIAVGLGEDVSAMLGKIAPSGQFAEKSWKETPAEWLAHYWRIVCGELWRYYGGGYRAWLEMRSRGDVLLRTSCGNESPNAEASANFRTAFTAYFKETKTYLYRLSENDDLAGTVVCCLRAFEELNRQYDRIGKNVSDKIDRLAQTIDRILPKLAPRGAVLSVEIRKRLVKGIVEEIPSVCLSPATIIDKIFNGKESK